MANKVLFGKNARDSMFVGIETVYRAVSSTLGASGRNVAYHQWGRPKITNDGVTIARNINPEDPYENMGAEFIKEAAEKTNAQAGDGTTTATVLARSIIRGGLDAIDAGANPMQLRREIEAALPLVIEKLKESSILVDTDESLINVATVSAESREIGTLIAEAVKDAGKDGVVTVEESDNLSVTLEKVDSMQIDSGYTSEFMVTNPYKMEAEIRDCPILLTDRSFNLEKDLMPIFKSLKDKGINRLLIIADDVSGEAHQFVITNRMKGAFHCVVVKKPQNNAVLEDIAILTGATAALKEKGIVTIPISMLGHADKVIVKATTTNIIGGSGDKVSLEARIEELRTHLTDDEHEFEKDKIQDRLARLVGKVNVIYVGASTETEMRYLKAKIDDAVNATRAAVEEGVVSGGGSSLYHIANDLHVETKGGKILCEAMKQPLNKIVENCGVPEVLLGGEGYGFNALTLTVEPNMIAAGIIDPCKVERLALENAVSLASTFLTTDTAIAEIPEPIKI